MTVPNRDADCFIAIDLGTTTTRVWLIAGSAPVHRLTAAAGARDTARDGNDTLVKSTLRDLIAQQERKAAELGCEPGFVVGAGMLTSELGLAQIPHLPGPAGKDLLQKNVVSRRFPDVTSLPVFLIPGVITGARGAEVWDTGTLDIIRGEETLCIGLLESGILHPGATLLNLGSHWKAIVIDGEGRIERSFTDLSGELMFAAQTHTILASAVPHSRPSHFDPEWVLHGIRAERKSGLSRALYSVRMLELGAQTSPLARVSHLIGSFISHTLAQLAAKSFIRDCVVVCGATGIVEAWKLALTEDGIKVRDHSEGTETAFIQGLIELSRPVGEQYAAR